MEKACSFSWHTNMNHHHHISFMELGHLLTSSGLTYPEVSLKVYHDSFYQLGSSISLPWVIYFEAFYLHVVSIFSFIPGIGPKLVLFFNSFAIHISCFTRDFTNMKPRVKQEIWTSENYTRSCCFATYFCQVSQILWYTNATKTT